MIRAKLTYDFKPQTALFLEWMHRLKHVDYARLDDKLINNMRYER